MEPNNVSYYPAKDPAANQLEEYKQTHKNPAVSEFEFEMHLKKLANSEFL